MNIETELARFVVNTDYGDLPSHVVDFAKKIIVDSLGIAAIGSTYPLCGTIVDLVKDWGGKEESTIWFHGGKVPCQNAALANGTMTRLAEFGCYSGIRGKGTTHPAETTIPGSLSLAEREGISGKEYILSVALGIELDCRMAFIRKSLRGFVGYPVFGMAAAASKILKLDEERTLNALGIAYSVASGPFQMLIDHTSGSYVHVGFRAGAGIQSALWAQRGITGTKNFIEGDYSLYNVYENREDCDLAGITKGLGEMFVCTNLRMKPYPTVASTQPSIDATLGIVRQYNVRPEHVDKIVVHLNPGAYKTNGSPLDKKRAPANFIEIRASIPFLVAIAVCKGDVFVDDITDAATKNADFLAMAKKVETRIDAGLEETSDAAPGAAIVEITTKEGEKFRKRVDFVLGDPRNPMPFGQVTKKFRRCVEYAARLDKDKTKKLLEMLGNLENVNDVSGIPDLLT